MTEPPSDPAAPLYDDLLRRARIVAVYRRIQRREAARRFAASVPRAATADLSAIEQARRGRG